MVSRQPTRLPRRQTARTHSRAENSIAAIADDNLTLFGHTGLAIFIESLPKLFERYLNVLNDPERLAMFYAEDFLAAPFS